MKNYLVIIFILAGIGIYQTGKAQVLLTEQQVVDSALKRSPLMMAADLQLRQSRQLRKTAYNFSNPDVMAESPTGEFYAIGVLQSVNFPTFYFKQGQLLKQQAILSEKERSVTQNDVKRFIRNLYLDLQYRQALNLHLQVQDSLFASISQSAARNFEAGQIDYLSKMFAESQYGEIHARLLQSEADVQQAQLQLQLYTGIKMPVVTGPIKKATLEISPGMVSAPDSSAISNTPAIQYWQQQQIVSRKTLQLEKHKALPGLVVGYLNQGPKTTPTYYRFRVGITVPLWFWQYSGNIRAAKTGLQISEQRTFAQRQSFTSEFSQAGSNYNKYAATLAYYETQGISQSEEIIKTSKRLFDSGQIDYISFLRTVNDAFNIKIQHLETLRNYNEALINMQYLTGKL